MEIEPERLGAAAMVEQGATPMKVVVKRIKGGVVIRDYRSK